MSFFDMGREAARDEFSVGIPLDSPLSGNKFVDLNWYSIAGVGDRGAPYQLVVSNEGTKLTYYRPEHWTDEDWESFCDDMEEDVLGTDDLPVGET